MRKGLAMKKMLEEKLKYMGKEEDIGKSKC